jgi:hypothetical protein
MSEQWPVTQTAARPALPSLEDLPRTGDGYDAERVQEAFDAFYRHIAKLDATLQALEAVEAFSHQAVDLRNELRAFRRARWQEGWNQAYGANPAVAHSSTRLLSPAVPRIAVEAAFLIAVAVILGIRDFSTRTIVATMAVAWLIVGLTEWVVSRERGLTFAAPPQPAQQPTLPPVADAGWTDEDEGLTIVAELEPSSATQR